MDEFRKQIRDTESQIKATITELDGIVQSFAEATATALAAALVPMLKQIGKEHPEVSNKLGSAQIAQLAEDTKRLAPRISTEALKKLQAPHVWFHSEDVSFDQNDRDNRASKLRSFGEGYGQRPFGEFLRSDIDACLNSFGDLLEKSGFVTHYGHSGRSYTDKHPIIARKFQWSEAMQTLIANYGVAFQALWKLRKQLSSLRREQSKNKAAKLWDAIE